MTLTEFLLARIAEDEAVARKATPSPWRWEGDYPEGTCPHETEWADHGPDLVSLGVEAPIAVLRASGYDASSLDVTDADAAHIARHDPARALAECEAKRRIVAAHPYSPDGSHCCADPESSMGELMFHGPCPTLEALALPYADHPDYQEEWKL